MMSLQSIVICQISQKDYRFELSKQKRLLNIYFFGFEKKNLEQTKPLSGI